MSKCSQKSQFIKEEITWSVLEQVARDGAIKMLALAMENEVDEFIAKHSGLTDDSGRRVVTKNGYMPQRKILTGMGPLEIRQPRIDDRSLKGNSERFTSNILPRYLRRIPSIDNLIPALYLKGISTNDFGPALAAILGENASGLSPANIVRLDDERSCILIIIGADKHGNKELVTASDGYRESKISWKEILLDLKRRGLEINPSLAIGDGSLGFWAAMAEVYPKTKRQRCWVHKTANILDKMPKSVQSKAKSMIHEMYMAPSKEAALRAYDHFVESYEAKYPKAVECLTKDKEDLFTFYDFPATHWIHIRTTNPVESTFATVRLRTLKTKGCGSRTATLSMVFKLTMEAAKTWKKLKGHQLILLVLENKKFVDGELVEEAVA